MDVLKKSTQEPNYVVLAYAIQFSETEAEREASTTPRFRREAGTMLTSRRAVNRFFSSRRFYRSALRFDLRFESPQGGKRVSRRFLAVGSPFSVGGVI